MGAADQHFFDNLRRTHYPADRLKVAAHLTLFRQLPPSALDELDGLVRRIAADTGAPRATIGAPFSLGTGVAFAVDSPDLMQVRARMADHFHGLLSSQDRGVPRLHITIQNKVTAGQARALLTQMIRESRPRALHVAGLSAHHYLGGPWKEAFTHKFRGARA